MSARARTAPASVASRRARTIEAKPPIACRSEECLQAEDAVLEAEIVEVARLVRPLVAVVLQVVRVVLVGHLRPAREHRLLRVADVRSPPELLVVGVAQVLRPTTATARERERQPDRERSGRDDDRADREPPPLPRHAVAGKGGG